MTNVNMLREMKFRRLHDFVHACIIIDETDRLKIVTIGISVVWSRKLSGKSEVAVQT